MALPLQGATARGGDSKQRDKHALECLAGTSEPPERRKMEDHVGEEGMGIIRPEDAGFQQGPKRSQHASYGPVPGKSAQRGGAAGPGGRQEAVQ